MFRFSHCVEHCVESAKKNGVYLLYLSCRAKHFYLYLNLRICQLAKNDVRK